MFLIVFIQINFRYHLKTFIKHRFHGFLVRYLIYLPSFKVTCGYKILLQDFLSIKTFIKSTVCSHCQEKQKPS